MEGLFLDGNYLQDHAAKHISQLLAKNDFITELVGEEFFEEKRRRLFPWDFSLWRIIDWVEVKVRKIFVR